MEQAQYPADLFSLISESAEREFDGVITLACTICEVQMAMITIISSEKQVLKSFSGAQSKVIPLQDSLCRYAISNPDQVLVVQDARQDPRFCESPLVTQEDIVFYVGIPLVSQSGVAFGVLCVFDHEPREISEAKINALKVLGKQVVRIAEFRKDKADLLKAKKNLKEEHKRLKNIIEATQVGTWEWNIVTDQLIYSKGWAEIIGYELRELGEISRKTRDRFIHPDDRKNAQNALEHYLQNQEGIYECKVRFKHKQGHWVWVLDRGQIMSRDDQGNPQVMFGTHTDITAQVTANEQLLLREKRFKALIENSDDAIAIIGLDGKPTYVSESIFRILGYTEAEALSLNFNTLIHPDDLDEVMERMKVALENPGIPLVGHTSRVRHKDGTWRYHAATLTNMLDNPMINGIIGNFKDVTDEILTNQLLVKREKRFRALAQEGADLVSIVDQDGSYRYLSPNYSAYLGESIAQLLGRNSYEFIHPEDLSEFLDDFSIIKKERKQVKTKPFRFRHVEKGWCWLQSVGTNLIDDPDIQGIVINSVDVTEVVAYQNQLKASNERFELVLKAGSESIWDFDPHTQNLFLSEGFQKNFGLTILSENQNNDLINGSIHPDDKDSLIENFRSSLQEKDTLVWRRDFRLRMGNGQYTLVRDKAIILRDENGQAIRVVGAIRDVSLEHFYSKLDQVEKEVMQSSISEKAEEKVLLSNYLKDLEGLLPGMKASILRIKDGKLSNLVSPSLDPKLTKSLEGLPIGENQGSCGTAAFIKERVIVEDVFEDSRWANYRDLAKEFGIGACWSFPLFSPDGKVIATLANYFPTTRRFQEKELQLFERSARLVTILIAKFGYLEKIRLNNERYELINKSTNEAIYDWDVVNDQFEWGESFLRVFGIDISQQMFKLSDWEAFMHPDDIGLKSIEWDDFLKNPLQTKWTNEFRIKKADQSYAFVEEIGYMIRDEAGQPIRMVGALRDQSIYKIEELSQQLQVEVTEIFKKQANLQEMVQEVVVLLAEFGGYFAGEFWLSGKEDTRLTLVGTYSKNPTHHAFFEDQEIMELLAQGQGLPGRVWKTSEIQLWDDLESHEDFVRKECARKFGFKSGIGLPVIFNDKVLGGLILFSERNLDLDQTGVLILEDLKDFLGKEIRRKQQEEELQLFFESAPDILAIASPNGYFTKVNPAFCALLGYTQEELTFVPFDSFVHPDDLHQTVEEFSETITAERHATNFTNRYRAKSGEYRYISWNSSTIFGQNGYLFAYGRDVTEFKKLENLLDKATQLARVGAWEMEMSKEKQSWSKITQEIFETEDDYYPNIEEGISFYREDYRDFVTENVNRAIELGEKFDFEVPIITSKGNERWVRAIGEAEFLNGSCTKIFGSIQDINDRKQIEDRLKSVSDNIPGVIFQYVLRPDGTDEFRFVSKGSRLIWGLDPRECMEVPSKVWDQITATGDHTLVRNSILKSANSLDNWSCEWRSLQPEGKIRWHQGIGSPKRQPDGSIVWDSLIMDVTHRKKLENLVEQSARMSKIGSWEIDPSSIPLQLNWSSTVREIVEVEGLSGVYLEEGYQVYVGESKARIREAMEGLINHGTAFDSEYLMVTSKGNQKWIRCIGQAELINGKVSRAFGSFQDIHDRKIAELNLISLFEEKNKILESIGDAFFTVTRDFTVTYWNHMAEKLLRTSREQILGKNLWEVFDDATNLSSFNNYHKALETGEIVYFEDFYPKINTWFSISAYPSDAGLTAYIKDITLAKRAEEEIQLSNERFERVVEATNDAIWDFQISENNLYWGKGFKTLFGYDTDLVKPNFDFLISCIHPEDRDRIVTSIQRLMGDKNTRSWNEEYQFKKADGSYAYVMDRATFIRDDAGNPLRAIGAMSDITQRETYEKSLQQLNQSLEFQTKELAVSNAELEQFAYVASHDLQEPLRMVSGFLSQLERKYKHQLDDKALQYIDFAVDGAVRMRRIILDLLEYSRVGKQNSQLEWVFLPEIIEDVKQLQRKLILEKKAEITFEGVEKIWTFRSPIFQIIQNLVGNALKYSKPNEAPKVEVKSFDLPDFWHISVSDNGMGIKEEYFDKIFVLFQRLHGKDEFEGTGIGLAIVKKIVEGLGGKIWVESTYQKGSIFHLTIAKPIV